jgi:sirohydrochlorin cobaltochelatase
MNPLSVPEIVLLLGSGEARDEHVALAERLAERLAVPVLPCFFDAATPSLSDALAAAVARSPRRVVVQPLWLGNRHLERIDALLAWAQERWPFIQVVSAEPLGPQPPILEALAERANDAQSAAEPMPQDKIALLLVGAGSSVPEQNAELAAAARLLWEGRGFGWVEYAFAEGAQPDVEVGIARCARLGARRVVVLPYLLGAAHLLRCIAESVERVRYRMPELSILLAALLDNHSGVLEALVQRYAALNSAPLASENGDAVLHRHGPGGALHRHSVPTASTILPPRYRGNVQVSAAPMAAADLVYDEQGRVVWDRIWGGDDPDHPFCELALAGGPPHRGELLEPVAPAEVQADLAGYTRVVMELLRGIHQTTGLKGIMSRTPGWIGVQCENEEMAIWLLRAIVVENVSARREGAVLFLPAGPNFRLEYEIKNVITALAKTHHYWSEHLAAM